MVTPFSKAATNVKCETLKKIFFNVYLFLREREREIGEGQRETETQNPKQAPGSELSTQSPTWGSNPCTHEPMNRDVVT